MVSWNQFASENPDLARVGEGLLFQFGVGLAFIATVRKDGAPRLHPVCPVLSQDRLYLLVTPTSPKRYDLLRDGRYALQSFPPPREESEEFYITGRARLISDPDTRQRVFRDSKHMAREDEVFFELLIERVMHTTWKNWGTPQLQPVHQIWSAPG
jgi:hypothetical protein